MSAKRTTVLVSVPAAHLEKELIDRDALLAALKDVLRHPDLVEDFKYLDRGVGSGTEFGRILLNARKVVARAEGR